MNGKKQIGLCRTFYYNPCDRKPGMERDPKKRKYCWVAYAGSGHTYQSQRFSIDALGETAAYRLAKAWRAKRAPLDRRASDDTRKKNNARRRADKKRAAVKREEVRIEVRVPVSWA